MKNDVVSVIIPAYNAETCINECLDNILSQSYRDIEVIVIDDGSTDGTIGAIKKYAKCDSRIKLLRQNHQGPNAARKNGVRSAIGRYVMFVDADDSLKDGAIELLVKKMRMNDVDVIRFNAEYSDDGQKVFPILEKGKKEKIIRHEDVIHLLTNTCKLNSLWMQFYKSELLKNVKAFDLNIDYGEDFLINLETSFNVERMLLIDEILYRYNISEGESITRSKDFKQLLKNTQDRIFVSCEAIKFIRQNICDETNREAAIYYQLKLIKWTFDILIKSEKYTKKKFILDFKKLMKDIKSLNIDEKKLKKYMVTLSFKEKIKNRRFVFAIIKTDYNSIWAYVSEYRRLNKILRRGK